MNLKTQIAVIVLALTATTSPVLEPGHTNVSVTDRPHSSGDVARYQTRVDCITGEEFFLVSGYRDLQSGRHLHRLWGPPVAIPVRGPNTVFGSASQAVIITRIELCLQLYRGRRF